MNPLSATEGLSRHLPTSQNKQTIVIVPSLLHTPAHFGPLCWYLETQGFSSFALRLPSSCSDPGGSIADDVSTIRRVLEELVFQNESDVVLVMHAYGVIPGCQAVTADLDRAVRAKEGKSGGVVSLVLIGGWLVKEGESIMSTTRALGEEGEVMMPGYAELETSTTIDPNPTTTNPHQHLFADLPPQKATYWASQLNPPPPPPPHSLAIYTTPVPNPPCWAIPPTTTMPTTYITSTQDPCARITDAMLAVRIQEGKEWKIRSIEAGHAPFLSRVEEVGGLILGAGREGGRRVR